MVMTIYVSKRYTYMLNTIVLKVL